MSYNNGMQICKKVLQILSSDKEFESRLSLAVFELEIITIEDVEEKYFNTVNLLSNQYNLAIKFFEIGTNDSAPKAGRKELKDLSVEIVNTCVEIIKHNAKFTL